MRETATDAFPRQGAYRQIEHWSGQRGVYKLMGTSFSQRASANGAGIVGERSDVEPNLGSVFGIGRSERPIDDLSAKL